MTISGENITYVKQERRRKKYQGFGLTHTSDFALTYGGDALLRGSRGDMLKKCCDFFVMVMHGYSFKTTPINRTA